MEILSVYLYQLGMLICQIGLSYSEMFHPNQHNTLIVQYNYGTETVKNAALACKPATITATPRTRSLWIFSDFSFCFSQKQISLEILLTFVYFSFPEV